MLPIQLLRAAKRHPVLIELKSGETYNGHLERFDNHMDCVLTDVICTSSDGSRFWQMKECSIRGQSIKYFRIPDEVLAILRDQEADRKEQRGGSRQFAQRGRARPRGAFGGGDRGGGAAGGAGAGAGAGAAGGGRGGGGTGGQRGAERGGRGGAERGGRGGADRGGGQRGGRGGPGGQRGASRGGAGHAGAM